MVADINKNRIKWMRENICNKVAKRTLDLTQKSSMRYVGAKDV